MARKHIGIRAKSILTIIAIIVYNIPAGSGDFRSGTFCRPGFLLWDSYTKYNVGRDSNAMRSYIL
jgi:hypothetical protein